MVEEMGELNGKIKVVRDHITLDKESVDALKQFIGDVYIMRQAQELYLVISSGENLVRMKETEAFVDETLKILVSKSKTETPNVRRNQETEEDPQL
jgi:hypothetical protein